MGSLRPAKPGSLLKGSQPEVKKVKPSGFGQRQPREVDELHLDAIRECGCVICGAPAEAAHIRVGSPAHGKRATGIAERPSDRWVLPVCPEHHRNGRDAQHKTGELHWWSKHGIDPLELAMALYAVSPNVEAMQQVIIGYKLNSKGKD